MIERFRSDLELAALIGSYDNQPAWSNVVSQYKNLMHHYIHQTSNLRATTFLGGLGAIRKEIFERIRGFDENRYRRPSIEDIELGYRLRRAGYQIRLEKQFQGKHLKKMDIFFPVAFRHLLSSHSVVNPDPGNEGFAKGLEPETFLPG